MERLAIGENLSEGPAFDTLGDRALAIRIFLFGRIESQRVEG